MGKNQQGFTLVELIIGMAILTLIMSGTYAILVSSARSYTYNVEQGRNIQDSRRMLNEVTIGIKNATAVSVPNSSTLNYSINADDYIISLDAVTDTINLRENTVLIQSWASGQVDALTFNLPVVTGSKVAVNISLTLKNSNDPQSTTVMTLNDIP